ncbi:MupA/Atu3671 family FMN-dependent luciferase-like monooxygenase [Ramlibacter sp. PS4R-6]|uniref:MupA/Atu3671 family FMN-dependent luciferase-like monooxygenase n=1 Tax=Ramlibacter sp. PS4R-6 TaxID=3133438 RepID=UPI003096A5C9
MGDGTLLVRCAQAWLDAGHCVAHVVTRNAEIAHWARDAGIAHRQFAAGEALQAPDVACDYLFSVANLEVLPETFLRLPAKLAVNFHDGPLPRYAGLNAPVWALLNGESQHGITWHEMTARVDAGRIVKQAMFPVTAGETSLELNARCYEAGLAAFAQIAADAARGELELTAQAGERTYFGRDKRPDTLATLDFTKTAREIVALVKALDFGTYANPLARPKLLVGERTVLVRDAQVDQAASHAAPGTVVQAQDRSVTVATAAGDVVLTLAEPVRDLPKQLPLLDAALRDRIAAALPALARGERHWAAALTHLAPVELPYPRELAGTEVTRVALDAGADGERTAQAFIDWLRALCAQERVTVLLCDPAIAQAARGLEPWLQDVVPFDGDFAQVRVAGPYPRDLPARLGEKHPVLDTIRIAVALDGRSDLPPHTDLMLSLHGERMELVAGPALARETVACMARQLSHWLDVGTLLPDDERERIAALNETAREFESGTGVHEAIAAQAQRTPDRIAVEFHGAQLTYREFDERSTSLARRLVAAGVQPGDIVGLCLHRSAELLIAQQAILKAGAAYLPLDPEYPRDRLDFMVEDSGTKLVITEGTLASLPGESTQPLPKADPSRAAYVIYTSGSTGKPKGVVVTHRNVMNFFAGMDPRIAHDPPGRWLAVTSLSFDISVLELCWTLARGFTVVLHSNTVKAEAKAPEFSLFYFASDHASTAQDRYRVLMEGAKFGDANGFSAVWTPERHFHAFGGLYPNPAVTSAAIAACTSRIQIRAGSCVLPLHHPIRVAEEWAFVDNISQGRVGISFASGWQPNDFVIAPDAFADRKNAMLRNIDVVRRLWRGEKLPFPGPNGKDVEVQALPRPIQKELPVWVTAAGNPETFEQAGTLGCHLLTHLLGQKIEDVAEKLKLYRAAWHKAGHAGKPHVTLMLHTFVGDDDDTVRETVRKPMKDYLRSSVDLIRQAAWSFPTFVQRAAQDGKNPVEIMEQAPLTEEETDALLEHAFNRYYGTSALFGTQERCLAMVGKLRDAGVDEIACLVDFGIATQTVLDHLQHLKALMDAAREMQPATQRVSAAEQVLARDVTHLQCTPSMASMLVADAPGRAALSKLQALMVGGEALPLKLAKDLRALVPGQLINMYGPTETTIWSTTCELKEVGDFVPLGTPIANTQLRVVNAGGHDCPALVPGELWIGGDGVTRGYHGRPELTAERFVTDEQGARWYRTGDLVRFRADGTIDFLGRIDHQVKIRGHRIELGEIESVLAKLPGVKDAVVIARDDASGEKRLLGYVTAQANARLEADALRAGIAKELPEIMVPQAVLVLPAFPSTPNGKVDRKALPEPNAVIAVLPPTTSTPNSELEKTIAAIWQDVLGLPQVGTTDNFFDLGGHSLLVVQVQRRLREACGREVSITDMFRLPTIKALAAHLGGGEPQAHAVNDGLARAQARRMMRSRAAGANTPA